MLKMLSELISYRKDRVKTGCGFLENNPEFIPAYRTQGTLIQGKHVAAAKQHSAAFGRVGRKYVKNGMCQRCLAASRFSYYAKTFAGRKVKTDIRKGLT